MRTRKKEKEEKKNKQTADAEDGVLLIPLADTQNQYIERLRDSNVRSAVMSKCFLFNSLISLRFDCIKMYTCGPFCILAESNECEYKIKKKIKYERVNRFHGERRREKNICNASLSVSPSRRSLC